MDVEQQSNCRPTEAPTWDYDERVEWLRDAMVITWEDDEE